MVHVLRIVRISSIFGSRRGYSASSSSENGAYVNSTNRSEAPVSANHTPDDAAEGELAENALHRQSSCRQFA